MVAAALPMAALVFFIARLGDWSRGGNDPRNIAVYVGAVLAGVVAYVAVLVVAGHPSRALQTITAILGCGALISLAFVAEFLLFMPFFGPTVTGIAAQLILLWSVPVEGHIIARALGRHWYIGIAIAIGVFVLQYLIYSAMAPAA